MREGVHTVKSISEYKNNEGISPSGDERRAKDQKPNKPAHLVPHPACRTRRGIRRIPASATNPSSSSEDDEEDGDDDEEDDEEDSTSCYLSKGLMD